jgi:hypothetical protein
MKIEVSEREVTLIKMVLDNEIVDFDQRLLLMDNGGAYTRAYGTRCELKVMASKFGRLKEAA